MKRYKSLEFYQY